MNKTLNRNLLLALLMLSCSVVFSQGTCGERVPFASEPTVDGCIVTFEMDLSIGVNWVLYPGNGLPQSESVSSFSCGCSVYSFTYSDAQGVIYPNISYYDANWNLICSSFYPITIDCEAPCETPPALDCSIETSQGNTISSCDYNTCEGGCVVLSVTEPGLNPSNYSYAWSANTPVGAPNNWYSGSVCQSGIYMVTISDTEGCTQVNTFNITINSTPDIVLSQDGPLTCDRTSVTLNTNSSGYCYEWSDGSSNSSLTVTTPGLYCVTVSDCNTECSVKVCRTVEEDIDAPNLDCSILDPDDNTVLAASCSYEICDDKCILLSVNGNENYTYTWDPTIGSNDQWTSNKICEAGTYTVTITSSNGCEQVKTFHITSGGTAPEVELSVDGTSDSCLEMVTITATEGYCYQWSNNLGTDHKVTVTLAGEYCVTVTDCISSCATVECIMVEDGPGSICNIEEFNINAEVNGVSNGGPYIFSDGLAEGAYLCWEFLPHDVPDWMIITIGGEEVVNTGNVVGLIPAWCNLSPYLNYCHCVDHFLGDVDGNNKCLDLEVGTALATSVLTQSPMFGDSYGLSTLSGSILITSDYACEEITVTVGNNCGEEYDKFWEVDLYCCDYPIECSDGYFTPPTNGYCCKRPDGGTTIQWFEVTDAVGYIITIDQEDSDCCPEVEAGSTTPISIEVAQNFFILPDNLPECFSWYIQAVGPNGNVSTPGLTSCYSEDAECVPYNPNNSSSLCLDYTDFQVDPCPANPTAPGPVDCGPTAFGLQLTWPAEPWAVAYTVVINTGQSDCCPEATEPGITYFQTTDTEVIIPRSLGTCFTYEIYAICEDFTTSPAAEGCVDDIWNCDKEKGSTRSGDLDVDLFSSDSNIQVYPNPVNDRMNIIFDAVQEGQATIQLRSMEGRLMKSMLSQVVEGKNVLSMDTERISTGIYFLQLETEGQKLFKKVVIQN